MHDSSSAEIDIEVEKLDKLAEETSTVLFSLKSHLPLDPFPDEITIEKTKVNFRKKVFFGSDQFKSIVISEISTVEVITTMLFASLRVYSRLPNAEPIEARYLKKVEARYARRLIQGLMVGVTAHIDVAKIPIDHLLPTLVSIGSTKTAE